MKVRAESLDTDLDKLKDAFSEISRLTAELTMENGGNAKPRPKYERETSSQDSLR